MDSRPWTQHKLALARIRDEIQATRPEGCWCLGRGGKDESYSPRLKLTRFLEWCGCPEGIAGRAEWERQRDEVVAQQRRERVEEYLLEDECPLRFHEYTFDTYPHGARTAPAVKAIRHWIDGKSADAKESLFIYGPYGSGKTGLGVATLHAEIEKERSGLFLGVPTLLDAIRRGYDKDADNEQRQIFDRARTVSVLLLDDLGAERATDWAADRLATLIAHRHDEMLTTIFTSNLSIQDLAAHIGERTVWRIVEMAEIVHLDGPNLRAKKAKP